MCSLLSLRLFNYFAMVALILFATYTMAAAKEKTLHNFATSDGAEPWAGVISDAAGNLYGTTAGGGILNFGTVFKLTPKAGGGWTEKVLHRFGQGDDGRLPFGPLIFDADGNLYGTTSYGGDGRCRDTIGAGCGIVFELIARTSGGWTERSLCYRPRWVMPKPRFRRRKPRITSGREELFAEKL
jgi:uncharacterized repeat protein (TIGR03803 family)